MNRSNLTALALAGLLSSVPLASFAGSTGPTNPVDSPTPPTTQGSTPSMDTGGAMDNGGLPPSTGTDPRVQGNDSGRQGGAPDPENGKMGSGSKTTTGGSGSEGNGAAQ